MTPTAAATGRLPAVWLALAVVLAYAGVRHGPFQFDDWWAIVGDARGHALSAWWQAQPSIRPLLKLANTVNWLLAPTPLAFRVVNVCLHAANAILLWRLLAQWLPALAPSLARPRTAAFVAALLFALHPAATEAVAYISGRSIALSTTLMLAALLAWSRALVDAGKAAGFAAWTGALACAAALAVRETAVVTSLAWLLLARCGGVGWRLAAAPLRPLALLLPLALLAAWATPGYHSFFGWSLQTRDVGAQLLGQIEAHRYLLSGPLVGRVLNIDPDVRVPAALAASHIALLVSFAAAAAVAWRTRRRHPWVAFALGWYLLQLAPANSLLPRFDLANDRHLYAALPGPLMLAAIVLAALRPRGLAVVLGGALVVAAGVRTIDRIADYRSETALWEATVAASPGKARAWTNLGFARRASGDIAGARHAFSCAHALDPGYAAATWNLAALGEDAVTPGEDAVRRMPPCPARP